MSTEPRRWPEPRKIALLTALYLVQGLPFGFQSNALPLYLAELGLTMTQVSFARALSLPWMFKALWGPLVDRFGRRKMWIIPLQFGLAASCAVAALFPVERETLVPFMACVLAMNVFAASQDVAVDGLAVDLLEPAELGAGNTAQVVGYKLGILLGGSALVVVASRLGRPWLFLSMALICLLVMLVLLFTREPASVHRQANAAVPWAEVVARLKTIVTAPGAGWLLAVIATYKLGETMADAMFGAYLVRAHSIPKEQVAVWIGTWGMVFSVAGSVAGGALATRVPLVRAVFIAAALRLLPLLGQWALVGSGVVPSADTVIPLTSAEHFFGGLLTTTMFALMMASVDRRIGATHFTVLATVEVIGKSFPGLLSGVVADRFGFQAVFALAVVFSLGFLALIPRVRAATSVVSS